MKQPRSYTIGDLHLGHALMCRLRDGVRLRPWETTDEMDEAITDLWNETVRPVDRIYLVGDAVINRRCLPKLGRLHGRKVLIKGNHDNFRLDEYTPYFEDVRGCHVVNGAILTHIPVHTNQLERFGKNIHGHMHEKRVMKTELIGDWADEEHSDWVVEEAEVPDLRYICVSAEQTGYKPVLIDEVLNATPHVRQEETHR